MERKMMFRPVRWAVRLGIVIVIGNLIRLAAWMPGRSYDGAMPVLTTAQTELRDELSGHVMKLAGEIGPRNFVAVAGLDRAADYIVGQLRACGYRPETQEYRVKKGYFRHEWKEIPYERTVFRNIIAELRGRERPDEVVVIGAHYDSVALDGCNGANDNASGVAALLALARRLSGRPQARTIRFVAFANEEPPFFQTEMMGSYVYASSCRKRGDRIVAMLAMDSLGYYSDAPGSQDYPVPMLSRIYPDRGNFIAMIGNLSSTALVRQVSGAFRARTRFPSQGVALPEQIPGVAFSDQWSFWRMGYPAVMITDTAVCRDPHYHTARDDAAFPDYAKMALVTEGLQEVLAALAGAGR